MVAFLDFVESADGQKELAGFGYRPVVQGVTADEVEGANDPKNPFPAVQQLTTIDDLGGWSKVNDEFFGKESGIVTDLRK